MTTETTAREASFTRSGDRITWKCNACQRPVTAGTGYLEADDTAATEQHLAVELLDDGLPHRLSEYPTPILWLAWHRACDPDPDGSHYWIEVDRIDTLARLVHWAGHLMGKGWIGETDFAELLERIGEYA